MWCAATLSASVCRSAMEARTQPFLSTNESNKRRIPGRIIGVSRDSRGKPALRMGNADEGAAHPTRQGHIQHNARLRRCWPNTAAAYAIYHGPEGLKRIARKVNAAARGFSDAVKQMGLTVGSEHFFDTVHVRVKCDADRYHAEAAKQRINFRRVDSNSLCVAFDETIDAKALDALLAVFSTVTGKSIQQDALALTSDARLALLSSLIRAQVRLPPPSHLPHVPLRDGDACATCTSCRAATSRWPPP